MKIKNIIVTTMGIVFLSALSLPSYAGDCKQVKFKFTNNAGSKIKVKSIDINGNDGSWTENIGNKQILTNQNYTTNKRKLNKLDSGKTGTFVVKYDKWNAGNNKWDKNRKTSSKSVKCTDGKTIKFSI